MKVFKITQNRLSQVLCVFIIGISVFTLFISCDLKPESPLREFPQGQTRPPLKPGEKPDEIYNPGTGTTVSPFTGNEGTWYQIFVWSYYDSDGDGIGDIIGIRDNLDHLACILDCPLHLAEIAANGECSRSMHIKGIWLSPIMPSPTYHGYDTSDYMDIDPKFGRIEDFRSLSDACHARGMGIILDLVVNHTAPDHEWFQKGLQEMKEGKPGYYAAKYNFHAGERPYWFSGNWHTYYGLPTGDVQLGRDINGRQIFFEGGFGPWMPDLNWDNEYLRDEFTEILKFWLIEKDVDGFRLDATKHIFEFGFGNGDTNKNIEFWTWFADTARSIKPTVFMVGESLDGYGTILEYHRPGMSSFALNFANNGGRIAEGALGGQGRNFAEGVIWWNREIKNRSPFATATFFLSNHDFDRSAHWLPWDEQRKMAASLLLLSPGMPFIYYGEEIGIRGWKEGREHYDKWVRGPMLFKWNEPDAAVGRPKTPPPPGNYTPPLQDNWSLNNPNGHGRPAWEERGGVYQQLTIEGSLLRHYIRVQNMKNRYPWIAWGRVSESDIFVDNDGQVGAYRVTDNDPASATFGKSVIVAHNAARFGRAGDFPDGYIQLPRARGQPDAVSAWGDSNPVRWDPALSAWWIKPYSTVIFREYDE